MSTPLTSILDLKLLVNAYMFEANDGMMWEGKEKNLMQMVRDFSLSLKIAHAIVL